MPGVSGNQGLTDGPFGFDDEGAAWRALRDKAVLLYGVGTLRTGWRCECGDLNGLHEAFCYRCGACSPEDADEAKVYDDEARKRGTCPRCGERIPRGAFPTLRAGVQTHEALVCRG